MGDGTGGEVCGLGVVRNRRFNCRVGGLKGIVRGWALGGGGGVWGFRLVVGRGQVPRSCGVEGVVALSTDRCSAALTLNPPCTCSFSHFNNHIAQVRRLNNTPTPQFHSPPPEHASSPPTPQRSCCTVASTTSGRPPCSPVTQSAWSPDPAAAHKRSEVRGG